MTGLPSKKPNSEDPPEADGDADPLIFRLPSAEDGPEITNLIRNCPPLDTNSAYCNLLQCTHFAETCVVAERQGRILGWISGYRPPSAPDRIFVWQVAVHPEARGLGLGQKMLAVLVKRPAVEGTTHLITTITDENEASWRMFTGFARKRGLGVTRAPHFERDAHFAGANATEHLVTIGPFQFSFDQPEKEDA